MLHKACDLKNEKACFSLASIYMRGIEGVVKSDFVEAYKLNLKSCEYRNPYACANLSRMHERGEGAEKNPKLAQTFKERALELQKELTEIQQTLQFGQGIKN